MEDQINHEMQDDEIKEEPKQVAHSNPSDNQDQI